MGASEQDPQSQPDERPQHRVSLDSYWIDRTEVTNAMFARCVEAGACHKRTYSPYQWGVYTKTRDPYYGDPAYNNYPVILLDADEAARYCQWAGRRLPTEAEWEMAARGSDARLYPWGSTEPTCELANVRGCVGDTSEVTAHPAGASPYGVLDMTGNVWEWTAGWYNPAGYAAAPTPTRTSDQYHTLRGGGWDSYPGEQRSSGRMTGYPEHRSDGQIGFRCALSITVP